MSEIVGIIVSVNTDEIIVQFKFEDARMETVASTFDSQI